MANIDARGGLQPVAPTGAGIKTRRYTITANYATALYIHDPVDRVAAGTIERATAGAGNPILGSILGFWKEGTGVQTYFPASSSGTWYAEVADAVEQEFVAREDGDTSDLALADRGLNADIIFTHAGDTTTGLSGMEIDSSSANTTANQQLRIIDLEDRVDNALGDWAQWRVKINYHRNAVGIVGAGV
jgi:hypothetical protein